MATIDTNIVSVIQAERGEKKNIVVLFRDRHKQPIDLSAGWTFEAVAYNADERLFTKAGALEFDLTGGASGELRIPTEFDVAGKWKLLITATRASPPTVLKPKFVIEISEEQVPEIEE